MSLVTDKVSKCPLITHKVPLITDKVCINY